MPQDSLPVWKATFLKLPIYPDPTSQIGLLNLANWISERVTGKLIVNKQLTISPTPKFTWNKATFISTLQGLVPTPDPIIPRTKMALAWKTSIPTSKMFVGAGAAVSPPPPPSNGVYSAIPDYKADGDTLEKIYAKIVKDLLDNTNVNLMTEKKLKEIL